jgi:hypothetical protein
VIADGIFGVTRASRVETTLVSKPGAQEKPVGPKQQTSQSAERVSDRVSFFPLVPQYSREGLIVQPVDAISGQYDDIHAVVDSFTLPEKLPAEALDSVSLDRLFYMLFRDDDPQPIALKIIAVSQKQDVLM